MSDLPKRNERDVVTQKAKGEMGEAFAKIARDHALSFGETLSILADLLGTEARGLIRTERGGYNDDSDEHKGTDS